MANFLQFLIPQEKRFFTLFEKSSENLVHISQALNLALTESNHEKRKEHFKEVERFEHVGDNLTHDIFNDLNSTFITPFDREDIHALASALDDIADFIHGASKRIDLYNVEEITTPMIKLSELIMQGVQELHAAIMVLRNMKGTNKIKEACVKINSIENHADDIFDMTIARLFEEEKDAVKVIKLKEVLHALEAATDKCEDAANVLEQIVVKNN